jgi:hypothetical protein
MFWFGFVFIIFIQISFSLGVLVTDWGSDTDRLRVMQCDAFAALDNMLQVEKSLPPDHIAEHPFQSLDQIPVTQSCWRSRSELAFIGDVEAAMSHAGPMFTLLNYRIIVERGRRAESARVQAIQDACTPHQEPDIKIHGRDRFVYASGWCLGYKCMKCDKYVQLLPDDFDFSDD